jgi:hypothetical protein
MPDDYWRIANRGNAPEKDNAETQRKSREEHGRAERKRKRGKTKEAYPSQEPLRVKSHPNTGSDGAGLAHLG